MKLHQKGFLLVELNKVPDVWDEILIDKTLREYGQQGEFWDNTIRVALDELAAAGLVKRLDSKLKLIHGKTKLTFRYALTDFGRARMLDTGLLEEVAVE